MEAGYHQELRELLNVAFANTSTHPYTMVIVHLDTHPALITVKGPGRSQHIARLAVGYLVHFFGERLALFNWDLVVLEFES